MRRMIFWFCLSALVIAAALAATVPALADPPGATDGDPPAAGPTPVLPLPFTLPSAIGGPLLELKDQHGPVMLSFSGDSALLASTNEKDEVTVFDLQSRETVWTWGYPKWLRTSLGELVWPWCPDADPTWQGQEKWEYHSGRLTPGWPGLTRAMFPPNDSLGPYLVLVHNASLSNSHVIVKEGEGVAIKEGVWLLGGYVHFFELPRFEYKTTVETETPQWLPLSVTIMHGLADVTAVAFAGTAGLMALGSTEGMVSLWSSGATSANRVRAETYRSEPARVEYLDFSPDGRLLATIGPSGVVHLFDVPSLAPRGELHPGRDLTAAEGFGHGGFWVRFSPDGSRLVAALQDGTLCVWNFRTGTLERRTDWSVIGNWPHFDFGSDSRHLYFGATRDNKGVVGEYSLYTGEVTTVRTVGLGPLRGFAISPRRDLIAMSDASGEIAVWTLREGLLAAR